MKQVLRHIDFVRTEVLNRSQKVRYGIKNKVGPIVYESIIEPLFNLFVDITVMTIKPIATFLEHVYRNQSNDTEADKFSRFKQRMALSMKLPVDMATGLIKTALLLPAFLLVGAMGISMDIHGLILGLLNSLEYFLKCKLDLFLFPIIFILTVVSVAVHVVLSLLITVFYNHLYFDVDTSGLKTNDQENVITKLFSGGERFINKIATNLTKFAVEIIFAPITGLLSLYNYMFDSPVNPAAPSRLEAVQSTQELEQEIHTAPETSKTTLEDMPKAQTMLPLQQTFNSQDSNLEVKYPFILQDSGARGRKYFVV